ATQTIPIVFIQVGDPVAQGLVTSITRPGGNATGFMNYEPTMGQKWLGFLKEIAPAIKHATVIATPNARPYTRMATGREPSGPPFNVTIARGFATSAEEVSAAIDAAAREPGGALIIQADAFLGVHRQRIVELAAKHRLPAMYPYRLFTSIGGLIAYGTNASGAFAEA